MVYAFDEEILPSIRYICVYLPYMTLQWNELNRGHPIQDKFRTKESVFFNQHTLIKNQ